ncbi:Lrp/AsnC family transcriptional regulator [Pedobacter heparinus]|uniref:Lrp/AsnC family transcriptional regulator n=1 Tax=Pedobacter heparinus TaxID=984 RepID=UPI00292E1B74|nr:Lrp/AsnC family transcriptional regulator [Pedobacter heparinus]
MSLNLDYRDIKILEYLQRNARIPMPELSDLVFLSPTATAARIKRLEMENYISHYTIVLNKLKVDKSLVSFTGVHLHLSSHNNLIDFIKEIKLMPQVWECYQLSGNFDFLLHIGVKDMQEYHSYITNKLLKMKCVDHIQTFFVMDELHHDNKINLSHLLKKLGYNSSDVN